MNLTAIIGQLEAERDRLDSAINALRGINRNPSGRGLKRRTLSAAARRRIAAANRARWAKVKAGKRGLKWRTPAFKSKSILREEQHFDRPMHRKRAAIRVKT